MTKELEVRVGDCAYISPSANKHGGEVGLVVGWAAPYEKRIYIYDGRYIELASRSRHRIIVIYRDGLGLIGVTQPHVLPLAGSVKDIMQRHFLERGTQVRECIDRELRTPEHAKPADAETIKKYGVMVAGIIVLCGFSQDRRISRRYVDDKYSWMDHVTGHSLLDWVVKKAIKA